MIRASCSCVDAYYSVWLLTKAYNNSYSKRLKASGYPKGNLYGTKFRPDIIDAIGGRTTTRTGQRYGLGQPSEVRAPCMDKLIPH